MRLTNPNKIALQAAVAGLCIGGAVLSQVNVRLEVPETGVFQYEPVFIDVSVANSSTEQLMAYDGFALLTERLLPDGEWVNIHALHSRLGGSLKDTVGEMSYPRFSPEKEVWCELQVVDLALISFPGTYRIRVLFRAFTLDRPPKFVGGFWSEWEHLTIRKHAGNVGALGSPTERVPSSARWRHYLTILHLQDISRVPPKSIRMIPNFAPSIEPAAMEILRGDFSAALKVKGFLGLAGEQMGLANNYGKGSDEFNGHYQAALSRISQCPRIPRGARGGGLVGQMLGMKAACYAIIGDVDGVRSVLVEGENYTGFFERRMGLRAWLEEVVK